MASIHSNWVHMFQDLKFSTQDFYSTVERHMHKRGIPNLKLKRHNLKEGGIFSGGREYLRIEYQDLAFDVCAAPFGNDFFVSWWFGSTSSIGKDMAGKLFGRLASGSITYFKLDTQAMFKESVKGAIHSAIDEITEAQGIRGLPESMRMNELEIA
jgi:hypothetical protein